MKCELLWAGDATPVCVCEILYYSGTLALLHTWIQKDSRVSFVC